jgi:superfamily I DNA/RNA helicase
MNAAQQRAATFPADAPLMVLAGAGSGKTLVITRRIQHLLAEGCPPDSVLAVTFTRGAAAEMRSRLLPLVGARAASSLRVMTFHGFALEVCRNHGHLLGYSPGFSIFTEREQLELVSEGLQAEGALPSDEAAAKAMTRRMLKCVMSAKSKMREETLKGLSQAVFQHYKRGMRERNGMDFNDIVTNAYTIFVSHKSVTADFRRQLRHCLVDEFQDTSRLQVRVAVWGGLELLARGLLLCSRRARL